MSASTTGGVVLLGLLGWQGPDPNSIETAPIHLPEENTNAEDEHAAFERYIANYRAVISAEIVPALKRGIGTARHECEGTVDSGLRSRLYDALQVWAAVR